MSTTRYITGIADGILTLTARALDPEGNPIATKIAITVNPNPAQVTRVAEKCYSQLILVSNPQRTLDAACVQFGTALTYYIGAPNNTIYSTSDCSTVAQDGYYKLEDGSWILVSGGRITQRGNCATVGVTTNTNSTAVTTVPEFIQPILIPAPTPVNTTVEPIVIEQPVVIPAPTVIPTQPTQIDVSGVAGPITVFVPTVTFTPPAPTLAPPPITVATVEPIIIEQPVLIPATPTTTTTTFTPTQQPTFIPAQAPAPQPIFGCTDPNAINYNPNATTNDGTCQYQSFTGGGGGFSDAENLNVI